jgi:hypothetical protein
MKKIHKSSQQDMNALKKCVLRSRTPTLYGPDRVWNTINLPQFQNTSQLELCAQLHNRCDTKPDWQYARMWFHQNARWRHVTRSINVSRFQIWDWCTWCTHMIVTTIIVPVTTMYWCKAIRANFSTRLYASCTNLDDLEPNKTEKEPCLINGAIKSVSSQQQR